MYDETEHAIDARVLSKTYRIWSSSSSRLRAPLTSAFARMLPPVPPIRGLRRHMLDRAAACSRRFQALQPLDLRVPKGQCLGIIGRNGSGKSTLLQLICGILQPTSGSVDVRGRIAALLELGSGFNPEFTGRENVYLNASILGLTKAEVDARFDEIRAFADIGDFVEQPVKTYSSGMMLRLAFAVQVLVDPDVLIVDEALSVGDEPFQRKCFARIERLREAGVTVLFVSHDMTPVLNLCDRAILLHKGQLLLDGTPKEVAAIYQRFNHAPADRADALLAQLCRESLENREADLDAGVADERYGASEGSFGKSNGAPETPVSQPEGESYHPEHYDPGLEPESTQIYDSIGASITRLRLLDEEGFRVNHLRRRGHYRYCYTVEFHEDCKGVNFAMLIKTLMGVELGGARGAPAHKPIPEVKAGSRYDVCFRFQCLLQPGAYCMNAGVEAELDGKPSYAHRVLDALIFKVRPEQDLLPTSTIDFLIEPSYELGVEALVQSAEVKVQS